MMYSVLFAFLAAASARHLRGDLDADLGHLPMENPDLFGGDMLGVEVVDRNVIANTRMRWTGRKVPYVLDPSVVGNKPLIESAIQDYHGRTCVRFVPRQFESNYIRIFAGKGCYSNVGMIGGQQSVSLGRGCMDRNIIIHELGHAIGFFHEQNRSDRDEYLIIYWQNIEEGMDTQFFKLQPSQNLLFTPFDYHSIMLYESTAFSKDGISNTMVDKTGQRLLELHQKKGLSDSDVTRVQKMYGC